MTVHNDVQELFQTFTIGRFQLQHRMVYAPLTRCRAIDTIPGGPMQTYYGQRASKGGLMLTEATCIMDGSYGCATARVKQQLELDSR
jgi:2,4-dienoyl-CoA reductase-like NADH-dependent reductase (Old Yellow Enzyme family)